MLDILRGRRRRSRGREKNEGRGRRMDGGGRMGRRSDSLMPIILRPLEIVFGVFFVNAPHPC